MNCALCQIEGQESRKFTRSLKNIDFVDHRFIEHGGFLLCPRCTWGMAKIKHNNLINALEEFNFRQDLFDKAKILIGVINETFRAKRARSR